MLDDTNLRKRYLSFCMMAMIIILAGVSGFSLRAYAQSQSGLDTQGKTELPLAVEGQIGLELLQPGTGPVAFPTNPPVVFVPGLVGIGTINPSTTFQVVGHSAATEFAGGGLTGFVQNWSDNAIIWKNANANGALRLGSANNLSASGWSEKMRITDSGLVGIGSTAPIGNLDVENGANTASICLNGSCSTSLGGGAKLISTTINVINNGGNAPCHSACAGGGEFVNWVVSCPGRYCRANGYSGGVAQEANCGLGINTPGSAVVLCLK